MESVPDTSQSGWSNALCVDREYNSWWRPVSSILQTLFTPRHNLASYNLAHDVVPSNHHARLPHAALPADRLPCEELQA